jgi:hypothetical protein
MGIRATGYFAGFDLEDVKSLRKLKEAMQFWILGGTKSDSPQLRNLDSRQRTSIEITAQTMERSPLLRQIITQELLMAPRDRNLILAAGKNLEDYAVPQAENPGSAAYNEAEAAYTTRQPLPPPAAFMRGQARNNSSPGVLLDVSDVSSSSKSPSLPDSNFLGHVAVPSLASSNERHSFSVRVPAPFRDDTPLIPPPAPYAPSGIGQPLSIAEQQALLVATPRIQPIRQPMELPSAPAFRSEVDVNREKIDLAIAQRLQDEENSSLSSLSSLSSAGEEVRITLL